MNYFKESIEEIKKVTWPTGNQALKVSIITIIFTLISTLIITGLDFSFRKGYDSLSDLSPKVQVNRDSFQQLQDQQAGANLDAGGITATDSDGNPIEVKSITP